MDKAPLDAIPGGIDRQQAHSAVKSWLLSARDALPMGFSEHTIPGLRFQLCLTVWKNYIPGFEGRVHVTYCGMPDTFADVVKKALENKLDKLVKTPADKRILLLEMNTRARTAWEFQRNIAARPEFPALERIDEIWVLDTSEVPSELRRWLCMKVWPNPNDVDEGFCARW